MDVTVHSARWNAEAPLRAVLLHMIHGYARHNGHAGLIREATDGTTGV
ncbi:DinB family protein [Saccharopolyspora kobensis]